MSAISGLGNTSLFSATAFDQSRFQDGEIVMFAIAMERANAAKECLTVQGMRVGAFQSRKLEMQQASATLAAAKEQIIAKELALIDEQIDAVNAAQEAQGPIGADAEGGPDLFANFSSARNLDFAIYIPPSEESDGIGSPAAYAANRELLQSYKEAVTSGTADNGWLRSELAEDSAVAAAKAQLDEIGVSGNIVTLMDLEEMSEATAEFATQAAALCVDCQTEFCHMASMACTAMNDLDSLAGNLRRDKESTLRKLQQTGEETETVDRLQVERMGLDHDAARTLSEILNQWSTLVARAGVGPDCVQRIVAQLPEAERARANQLLLDVKSQFQVFDNSRQELRNSQSTNASFRRLRV